MSSSSQLKLADPFFHLELRKTQTADFLTKIDTVIDWNPLVEIVSTLDKTSPKPGGISRHNTRMIIKALFLQHYYGLSEPQLEELLQDCYFFQQFVGFSISQKAPDFTTIWRFKHELIGVNLIDALFGKVNEQLEAKGLFVRKGSILDATMVESANISDGLLLEQLVDTEAGAVFADKAYADIRLKVMARQFGWYYGMLKKHPEGGKLTGKQIRRDKLLSRIRSKIKHPSAWMKTQSKGLHAGARSMTKNALSLYFSCMCWNLYQTGILLAKET